MDSLRLFVYGTLKRGGSNCHPFCRTAKQVDKATVWGRLYCLPDGYPALCIPTGHILARGSPCALTDTCMQNILPAISRQPTGDWHLIYGEVMTFTDPASVLPPIDALEEFDAYAASNPYERVLVTVGINNNAITAWLYHVPRRRSLIKPPGPLIRGY